MRAPSTLDYILSAVPGYGIDYEVLLFHIAVHWLPKGDFLNWFVQLLSEVSQCLGKRNKGDLKAAVFDKAFQCRLAFLVDMFSHLNKLMNAGYRARTPRLRLKTRVVARQVRD